MAENLGFRQNFRVDPDNPEPIGRCDRCGKHRNLSDLVYQTEWRGESVERTGMRVCNSRGCLDQPNEQLRTLVLKPDPEPAEDPRPGDGLPPIIEDDVDADGRTDFSVQYSEDTR